MSSDNDNKKPGRGGSRINYSDVDAQMGHFARTVEVNERILQRLQKYELMLLDSSTLAALLDVLLLATPRLFGLGGVSLCLHDPEGYIRELMPEGIQYGDGFQLVRDSFDMQQRYGATPEVEVIDIDDPRAEEVIAGDGSAQSVVLLPLVREGLLVGSFHWLTTDVKPFNTSVEMDYISHLADIIAICVENCVNAERLAKLSLVDPLTRLGNRRAFEMELRKEVSRAQRNKKGLTILMLEVDQYQEVADNYGYLAADFMIKTIATHIYRPLRRTDMLARYDSAGFALLLPTCTESKGQEIAERIRSDTEFMEIDDGRGANLFASLSIGLTSWNPQNYPAVNMEQLARQMETSCRQGLQRARSGGGNRVNLARLTAMLV
jgi:diguanylate cyclase (GGDEF)-like protein